MEFKGAHQDQLDEPLLQSTIMLFEVLSQSITMLFEVSKSMIML